MQLAYPMLYIYIYINNMYSMTWIAIKTNWCSNSYEVYTFDLIKYISTWNQWPYMFLSWTCALTSSVVRLQAFPFSLFLLLMCYSSQVGDNSTNQLRGKLKESHLNYITFSEIVDSWQAHNWISIITLLVKHDFGV